MEVSSCPDIFRGHNFPLSFIYGLMRAVDAVTEKLLKKAFKSFFQGIYPKSITMIVISDKKKTVNM